MKKITQRKMIALSMGNFGQGLLTGIVMSWLIYFYQPTKESGFPVLIPTTLIFGFLSILGLVKAIGHIFDAVTDPWVASMSDRSKNPNGRRIPFMKRMALPFAFLSSLIFLSPVNHASYWNALFLALVLYLYYFVFTLYIVPYNALLPEVVSDPNKRLSLFTMTSLTFILGTGVAYLVPTIATFFKSAGCSPLTSWRITFALLCVIGFIALLIPALSIKETEYVVSKPTYVNMTESIKKTFHYRDFRIFVGADLVYFIALAFFQAALAYYVEVLLGLPDWLVTIAFMITMALSICFYLPVNALVHKFEKKRVLLFGFALFTVAYLQVSLFHKSGFLPPYLQAGIAFVPVALAMAIFGILPNTVISELAEYDAVKTGDNRQGMFFAARSFVFKIGQSIAYLIIPAVSSIGKTAGSEVGEVGVRLTSVIACIFCVSGFLIFTFYDEKKILTAIRTPQK